MGQADRQSDRAHVRPVVDGRAVRSVLITGADGYVGRLVVARLAQNRGNIERIVATDIRPTPDHLRQPEVVYEQLDVRGEELAEAVGRHGVDTVIHLAAVVTPRPGDDRAFQYAVDVEGTRNVVQACLQHGVGRLVYTSSGAAYGYSPANPALLREDEPLRAEEAFAYSWHKRLVEEMLAEVRQQHPGLEQVVLRVSTVLGETVRNQITALFERPVVVGIAGAASPFCFIWDQDLAECIVQGVRYGKPGVYNITGDGVMTLREIASAMGRRYLAIRADLVAAALRLLQRVGKVPYGPEQVRFLRHRPVLDNRRLVRDFPFRPSLTSRQVFELYRSARCGPGVTSKATVRPADQWAAH